ncbi:MAG: hypothetical protein M1571_02650 [Firmicutes bacterium]|nr:hypothetical protein [Bacillota bacterium]
MNDFYYDEERATAYKVSEPEVSVVPGGESLLVHVNLKATNYKKEKVRRTVSEMYPADRFTPDSAKAAFIGNVLPRVLGSATRISREEYDRIKERVEA